MFEELMNSKKYWDSVCIETEVEEVLEEKRIKKVKVKTRYEKNNSLKNKFRDKRNYLRKQRKGNRNLVIEETASLKEIPYEVLNISVTGYLQTNEQGVNISELHKAVITTDNRSYYSGVSLKIGDRKFVIDENITTIRKFLNFNINQHNRRHIMLRENYSDIYFFTIPENFGHLVEDKSYKEKTVYEGYISSQKYMFGKPVVKSRCYHHGFVKNVSLYKNYKHDFHSINLKKTRQQIEDSYKEYLKELSLYSELAEIW